MGLFSKSKPWDHAKDGCNRPDGSYVTLVAGHLWRCETCGVVWFLVGSINTSGSEWYWAETDLKVNLVPNGKKMRYLGGIPYPGEVI